MSIRQNVGCVGRAARLVLGTVLPAIALFAPLGRPWRIAAASVGGIALATGASGYCPLNQALGIDTRHRLLAQRSRFAS